MKDDNGKLDGKSIFSSLCTELECGQGEKEQDLIFQHVNFNTNIVVSFACELWYL